MGNSNYVWERLERRLEAKLNQYKSERKQYDLKRRIERVTFLVGSLSYYIESLKRFESEKTFGECLEQIKKIRSLVKEDFLLSREAKDKMRNELNWVERFIYDFLRVKYLSDLEKDVVDVFVLETGDNVPKHYLVTRERFPLQLLTKKGDAEIKRKYGTFITKHIPQLLNSNTLHDMARKGLIKIEGPFDLRNDMESYLKALGDVVIRRILKREAFTKIIKEPIGKTMTRKGKGGIGSWPVVTETITSIYNELLPFYWPTEQKFGFRRKGKMDIYHGELLNDILEILKDAFPKLLNNLTKKDIVARIQYWKDSEKKRLDRIDKK